MRTTIELNEKLFRRAKLAAVSRGISFKKLVEQGVQLALKTADSPRKRNRIKLPLLGSKKAGKIAIPADIDFQSQQAEDLARYAALARR
jgi:hypothetical protein